MNRKSARFVQLLIAALVLLTALVAPAYAQTSRTPATEPVRIQLKDGTVMRGIHQIADDFVLVCPVKEVLDPSHPCSETNSAAVRWSVADDFVLVCPVKEVLDPAHPCSEANSARAGWSAADDLVLVCPVKEVLDPSHPCSGTSSATVRWSAATDFVLTCPVKEVLDPYHPCADR